MALQVDDLTRRSATDPRGNRPKEGTQPRGDRSQTRRGLLAGALGVVAGGFVAGSAGAVPSPGAGPLLLGERNTSRSMTSLVTNTSRTALRIANRDREGVAIAAHLGPPRRSLVSLTNVAVHGSNSGEPHAGFSVGVSGDARGGASAGLLGVSDTGTGVMGTVGAAGGDDAEGVGVTGTARAGTGGLFEGATGIEVLGRNVFSQAGTREVPAGSTSYDVVGVKVGANSFILAMMQGSSTDVWVTSARRVEGTAGDGFRVHFNTATPVGGASIAFFVLN